jgi:hypothetical protein
MPMPYPRAHYYVLGVIAVIIAGFWPSYWAVLGTSRWQFHLHGAVSSVWVLMVMAQSWSAHNGQLALHRATGRTSLFLFPLLIGGLTGIIDVTAKNYRIGDATESPITMLFGPAFLVGLVVALAAYVTLYFLALKNRRKVWPHAGYLLGTPIILFESPFSRMMTNFGVPGFIINGPQDFDKVVQTIIYSDAIALLFCLVVYWRVGARARPFLVTAAFVGLQMATMGLMNEAGWLKSALIALGAIPSIAVVAFGAAIGAATRWAGWQAGKRPAARIDGAVQPA